MKKDELMKYAEQGVREELSRMQLKINELARLFPHIVCHQDGSVPAIVPITMKATTNGTGKKTVRPKAERLEQITKFLKQNPGASTREIGAAINIVPTHVLKLAREIAKPINSPKPGSKQPIQWKLK